MSASYSRFIGFRTTSSSMPRFVCSLPRVWRVDAGVIAPLPQATCAAKSTRSCSSSAAIPAGELTNGQLIRTPPPKHPRRPRPCFPDGEPSSRPSPSRKFRLIKGGGRWLDRRYRNLAQKGATREVMRLGPTIQRTPTQTFALWPRSSSKNEIAVYLQISQRYMIAIPQSLFGKAGIERAGS